MAPALVLLPAALLALAALAAALVRRRVGTMLAALLAWASAGALVALWIATHGALDLATAGLGAGIPFGERLDGVAFACSLALVVPGAALLTWRSGVGWTLPAALAAAELAVGSADLLLAALLAGLAVSLSLDGLGARLASSWSLWFAVVALAWAAVALQVVGGTAGYDAAPAAALNVGIAGLVLLAALALLGVLPGPGWAQAAWSEGAFAPLAALPPIGFCLLLRAYTVGDGRLPAFALNVALALAGTALMLLSAWRAQAAPDRPAYLAEALPGTAAGGVIAAAAGVQLGALALVFTLFSAALIVVLLALASERRREDGLLLAAVIAGFPGTLAFAARLLSLQAALEAQQAIALCVLPAALGWLLWLAAGTRAAGLPPATGGGGRARSRWLSRGTALASLLLGSLAGPIAFYVGSPAVGAAGLGSAGPRLTFGTLGLEPVSGGWPALGLGGLVLAIALAVWVPLGTRVQQPRHEVPPPLPAPPAITPPALPAFPRLAGFEAALNGGRPLVWAGLLLAAAVLLTRP